MPHFAPGALAQPAPPPYEATQPQPQPAAGSVMVILFSMSDESEVTINFRNNSTSLAQCGGILLTYQQKLAVLPTQETGAIIIYFQTTQDGISWFHTLPKTDASVSSRLWVLIAENKTKLGDPASHRELATMSIRFIKRKPDFNGHHSFIEEYKKLLNTALNPAQKRFGGRTIISANCVTVISGDWSGLLSPDDDVTSVVTQRLSLHHYEDYTTLFQTDPGLIRYTELFKLNFVQLSSLVLERDGPMRFDFRL